MTFDEIRLEEIIRLFTQFCRVNRWKVDERRIRASAALILMFGDNASTGALAGHLSSEEDGREPFRFDAELTHDLGESGA